MTAHHSAGGDGSGTLPRPLARLGAAGRQITPPPRGR